MEVFAIAILVLFLVWVFSPPRGGGHLPPKAGPRPHKPPPKPSDARQSAVPSALHLPPLVKDVSVIFRSSKCPYCYEALVLHDMTRIYGFNVYKCPLAPNDPIVIP